MDTHSNGHGSKACQLPGAVPRCRLTTRRLWMPITCAYVKAAEGNARAALQLAVSDALHSSNRDGPANPALAMVSRGFIKAGAGADQRSAP